MVWEGDLCVRREMRTLRSRAFVVVVRLLVLVVVWVVLLPFLVVLLVLLVLGWSVLGWQLVPLSPQHQRSLKAITSAWTSSLPPPLLSLPPTRLVLPPSVLVLGWRSRKAITSAW
jgi:hypothetical protein